MNDLVQAHLNKKAKKKAQNKKNMFHQQIFSLLRMRRTEEKHAEKAKEIPHSKRSESDKTPEIWSDKVATIRNRLDGQKRTSKERWNRFAGTGSGGARGL